MSIPAEEHFSDVKSTVNKNELDNDLKMNDNDLKENDNELTESNKLKQQRDRMREERDLKHRELEKMKRDLEAKQRELDAHMQHRPERKKPVFIANDDRSNCSNVGAYEALPEHLRVMAKEISARVTIFDGKNFQNWRSLVEKVMKIYGLHHHLTEPVDDYDSDEVRNDAFVAGYIEAHLSDSIKSEVNFGNGSALDLWDGLLSWFGERDQNERQEAFRMLRYLRLESDVATYSKAFLHTIKQMQRFDVNVPNQLLCYLYLDGLGSEGQRMRDKFLLEDIPINRLVSQVQQLSDQAAERIDINHVGKPKSNRRKAKTKNQQKNNTGSEQKQSDSGQSTEQQPQRTSDRYKKVYKNNNTYNEAPIQLNVSQADKLCRQCNRSALLCTHSQSVNAVLHSATDNDLPDGAARPIALRTGQINQQYNCSTPKRTHTLPVNKLMSVAQVSQPHELVSQFNTHDPDLRCPHCGQCYYECDHSDNRSVNVLVASTIEWNADVWLFDTGSSVNLCNNLKWFLVSRPCKKEFTLSNGSSKLKATAVGTVRLILTHRNKAMDVVDVYHCPDSAINLLTNIEMAPSVRFYGGNHMIYVSFEGEQRGAPMFEFSKVVDRQNRLLVFTPPDLNAVTRSAAKKLQSTVVIPQWSAVRGEQPLPAAQAEATRSDTEVVFGPDVHAGNQSEQEMETVLAPDDLRHQLATRTEYHRSDVPKNKRYFKDFNQLHGDTGHWCYDTTRKYAEKLGVRVIPESEFSCSICDRNNIRNYIDINPADRAWIDEPLKLLHMDVCGQFADQGYDGSKFFVTAVEDFTCMVFAEPIAEKSHTFTYFLTLKEQLQTWFDRKIKVLRTDKGGEFMNKNFYSYEKDHGLRHEWSSPYVHYENGKAERAHQTIRRAASKLLEDAGLPEKWWPEAVRCAAYLFNRRPSYNSSAHFRFYKHYDDRCIYRFGSRVFYLDFRPHANKIISQKGRPGVFMGYNLNSKDYRVWDAERGVIVSAHVVKPTGPDSD